MNGDSPTWNLEPPGLTELPAPQPAPLPPAEPRPVPVATLVIAALCGVVFLFQVHSGGSKNPYVLLDFGASYRSYFLHGQYFRAVMPLFLHIGWWHLAMNMVPFLLLGPVLEEMFGYGRYACIYLGAGIAGVLVSMFVGNHESAGASGAIMGVIAAIPTAGHFHRRALPIHLARVFRRGRLTILLVVFMVMELVSGFTVHDVDNWGHLGGLLGGALLALLIPPPGASQAISGAWQQEDGEKILRNTNAWRAQWVVVIPIAIVALAMFRAHRHYQVAHQVSLLLEQSQRLAEKREPGQAMDALKRASKLDPGDDRPYAALGGLELDLRQPAKAIEDLRRALQLNPESAGAAFDLAAAYEAIGNTPEAQHALESVLKSDPNNVEVLESLADLFAGEKRYPEAIADYKKVLKLRPTASLAQNNLAWLYATAEQQKYRDPAAALDLARKAVGLTKGRVPSFVDTLAEAYYANGNFTDAVKVEARALQMEPGNIEYQQHMARYRQAAENPNPSVRD